MPEKLDPQLDELRRRARRRLVGAIVLALAAAVLVPMLLESDPKPLGEDVSVKIPPVDEGRFVTRLGEKSPPASDAASAQQPSSTAKEAATKDQATKDPAAKETTARETAPKEAPAEATKEPSKDPSSAAPASPSAAVAASGANAPTAPNTPAASREAAVSRTADTREPSAAAKPSDRTDRSAKAADAPRSAPVKGSYSVQLAAFSDDKGANALAGRLKKAGHPAYTEPYSTSRGTLYRVRVGPYATREAAESARARLKADGQNGIIATAAH